MLQATIKLSDGSIAEYTDIYDYQVTENFVIILMENRSIFIKVNDIALMDFIETKEEK